MQAIMETLFDIVYLTLVITVGIRMMIKGRKEKQYFWFGVMAVILGSGDAFHLLPRADALCTTGRENFTAARGVGKLVTSVTMTIFYVLLYYVWRTRYHVQGGNWLEHLYLPAGSCKNCSVSIPAKRMDISRCAVVMGDIQKYSVCIAWGAYHCSLLSKGERNKR